MLFFKLIVTELCTIYLYILQIFSIILKIFSEQNLLIHLDTMIKLNTYNIIQLKNIISAITCTAFTNKIIFSLRVCLIIILTFFFTSFTTIIILI